MRTYVIKDLTALDFTEAFDNAADAMTTKARTLYCMVDIAFLERMSLVFLGTRGYTVTFLTRFYTPQGRIVEMVPKFQSDTMSCSAFVTSNPGLFLPAQRQNGDDVKAFSQVFEVEIKIELN